MTGTDVPPAASRSYPEPSRSQSMQLRWRRFQRSTVFAVTTAGVVALVLGVLLGRATAPSDDVSGATAVAHNVVRQLQELRRSGDPEAVLPHVDDWLQAYDTVLLRIVGVDVPPAGRSVQRQYVLSVTLNRDAVEVLGAAAAVEDPTLQRELTSEALRLRMRAEEAAQTAQASLADLEGRATGGVSVPRELPGLAELR